MTTRTKIVTAGPGHEREVLVKPANYKLRKGDRALFIWPEQYSEETVRGFWVGFNLRDIKKHYGIDVHLMEER